MAELPRLHTGYLHNDPTGVPYGGHRNGSVSFCMSARVSAPGKLAPIKTYVGDHRVTSSCLIYAFATIIQVSDVQRSQLNGIPPDGIDDFLTRGTPNETFCFADDSQLDGIANGLFEVVISLLSRTFEDTWITSRVHRPVCSNRQGEVE